MTFSITAAGTIEQVRAQVECAKAYGDDAQFEQVKAFILAAFNDDPDVFDPGDEHEQGAVIEASGYKHAGVNSLSLLIRPLALRKPVAAE